MRLHNHNLANGYAILLPLVSMLLVPTIIKSPAYAQDEEWQTHYAVNGFVNTGPADPHEIFKIHYRGINGTIERFSMPYVEYAHDIKADVKSEGNSTLEIRFPKNYPSSDAEIEEFLDAIIFFNEQETLAGQVYTDDCFIDYSIPFSGSGTIDVVRTTIFSRNQFHGIDVPERCIPETIVQDIVKTRDGIIPPLHQIKAGVSHDEVACSDYYELVVHPNGRPYCTTPNSVPILKERWDIR